MKHLCKLFILMLVLCLVPLWAFTADAADAEIVYTETVDKITVTVYSDGLVKYTGSGALNNRIYYDTENTVMVEIGKGITEIGEDTFGGCFNLKSVKFPSTLKTIGPNAFYECEKLTSVTLPNGLKKIGSGAFFRCALTSITIPDSVTSLAYDVAIGESALGAFDCPNLTTAKLGKGITNIPWGCFCSSALESINIPNSVTRIDPYAFGSCTKLTSITIPASVVYIGSMAFVNTFSLTNVIFLGDVPEMESPFFCASFNGVAYYPKGNSSWEKDLDNALWSTGGLMAAVPYTVNSDGKYIPVAPTTAQVTSAIAEFITNRPAGTAYFDSYSYIQNGKMATFYGKEAFAVEMSDYCFGYLPLSSKRAVSYSKLKVGDILYKGSDVWVITKKTSSKLELAGVQDARVTCGVSMTKAQAEAADGYRTRVGVALTAGKVDPALTADNVTGPDHVLTEAEVYEALLALQTEFPEGMPYSSKNHYRSNVVVMLSEGVQLSEFGHGCSAFGYYTSDTLFGYLPARYTDFGKVKLSNIKVGDRLLSANHEMVVLEVYSNCVIVVEGNYNGQVHWGRKISATDISSDYAHITRYPEGTKSAKRTTFKCTHKYLNTGYPQEDGTLVYTCNSCGEIQKPEKLKITKQPVTTYAKNKEIAKVTVKAKGDGLKYTWYIKNAGASKYTKSSVTKSSYSVAMSSKSKDRLVYCVVKDQYGNSIKTKTVRLRMAATVTKDPVTDYAKSGEKASLTVKASGDGLKYTWYIKNAGATKYTKSSVTKSTYSVTMNSKVKDRLVYCVVTDQYGNTDRSETVRLRMAASITTQPKDVTVAKGSKAKVTVKATGDELTYTWYIKNPGSSRFSKSSVTRSSYSVTMTSKVNGRKVYCVVTDKYGNTVKSNVVTLRMKS